MGTPNLANLTSRLALAVMIVFVGCGSSDHPSPAEESADADELAARAMAELERRRTANDCTPGSVRPCHFYWTDARGQVHCPQSTEVCRPEGHGWFPCGAVPLEDAGVPRLGEHDTTGP
jgi:hypothetical protein